MPTLCKRYSDESVARHAVEELRADGVPDGDLLLLTGSPVHDVRRERVGTFAGAAGPDAAVGTYAADVRRLRRQGAGAFAGDPDRQRQGTFADSDRDLIVTYEGGAEHPHVAGDTDVLRLLRDAHVPAASRLVDELHSGHAVVLATPAALPSQLRSARR